MKLNSFELLSFLVRSEIEDKTIAFSSLYNMREELRKERIFCDLSIMDFEDLKISYPECVEITMNEIHFKTKFLSKYQFDTYSSFYTFEYSKIIEQTFKKYLK